VHLYTADEVSAEQPYTPVQGLHADAVEAAAEEHVRADAQWRERYEELEKENAALRRAQKTAHST
jgi:hypothetical protein